nr:reverse transcriptase domain-containing protein [Tanacetum cinerariifolium]
MMRVTTSFLRRKWQLKNHERKKSFPPWRQQEGNQKHGFRNENFWNQQRPKRKQDRFTLLTKTPKEIFALEKGKFKAPPLMTTPVEKRNHTKFCEFHGEVRHNTDECMHLKKQIEEMLKAGKLSYLIKELKQNNGKEKPKTAKKRETPGKEKPSPPPYNGIIGRPGVRKLQAVLSTAHGMLKISIEGGIITLKSSMLVPLECVMVFEPEGSLLVTKLMVEERIKLEDMTDVPRHIVEHRLNVREGCSPVRKKKKRQAADINQAIQEEVGKLLEADFKDLNKACPKDGYPLPEIDWKVESLCGFPFKCVLDAYKGYHQIQMAKENEEKTAFITSQRIFCYKKMPFGLKNAGASYQRLVDKAFHKQISRNLEVPRVSDKGQILADFIVERPEEDSLDTLMTEEEKLPEPWITDGSSCTDGSGIGLILINPEEMEFIYALRFRFDATNNEAKYEALISKLKIAKQIGEKSISTIEVLAVVEEEGDTWMTPIFKYLTDGTLPADSKKARAAKRKSWRFAVVNRTLYKKSFLGPWLRFGLPREIISDNGKRFQDDPFKDWCEKLCIRQHFASIKHLQTNGLVERAYRNLREGIKARLDARSKNWMKELPRVLWAHRTMIKSSNGDTRFLLTYRTEAVIPTEIGMPTLRMSE